MLWFSTDAKGYCWITKERQKWLCSTLPTLSTGQFKLKRSTLDPECSSWLWQHCLSLFHAWWDLIQEQQHGEWGIPFIDNTIPSRPIFRDELEEMLIDCSISLDTALTLMCHHSWVLWVPFRDHGRMDGHSAWKNHLNSWLRLLKGPSWEINDSLLKSNCKYNLGRR